MNNIITAAEAFQNAVRYAHLENNEPVLVSAVRNNGLYELTVLICLQKYDFYVGAVSGEILGVSCEPVLNMADTISYSFEKAKRCA